MNIETHIPTELLSPFIKKYLIVESRDGLINRLLPDTSLVIAFRYKGQVNDINDGNTNELPASVISGLRKSVRLVNYLNNTSTILVLFKEAGAAAFFKVPLHRLFESSVPLDNFIAQQKILDIEDQLAGAENNDQRIAVIEAFLSAELYNYDTDKLVTNAIQQIHSANGIIKIKKLADAFFISQDAFEKRFRRTAGTSPKRFASIIRMRAIIKQRKTARPLGDLAFSGEYFDQAHFSKDFKLFTGQTPTEFFNAPVFW